MDNFESTKPAIIGSFVSDIVLLLIMLIGLRPLRGGAFALGHTLWKQVRLWQFLLVVVLLNSLTCISVRKGLIWLLLATVAEVPSTVCLAILLLRLRSSLLHIIGARDFEFEWWVFICFNPSEKGIY